MDDKDIKFQELVNYYSTIKDEGEQELLIRLLHETQDIYGHIPFESQSIIAEKLSIKESTITVLIKMIPSLTNQTYQHKVIVCSGPRCGAKGGSDIINAVQNYLDVKPGQVTKDGVFYFTTQNCLKKCGLAPNMYIGDNLHSRLTPEQIPTLFQSYLK